MLNRTVNQLNSAKTVKLFAVIGDSAAASDSIMDDISIP
jgi:hypothetical protein